jgi:uncharacterized membrane protein YccC
VSQHEPDGSQRDGGQPARPGLSGAQARTAVLECTVLAVACFVAYWLVTHLLSRLHSISPIDDIVGGLWAVIGTIFVSRNTYQKSFTAGVSRIAGTLVSFALCLVYLVFLPFHVWALALLIGLSSLIMILIGRPGDALTAAVATAVLITLAQLNPQHAWEQPILRLADTIIGVIVGVAVTWLGRLVIRQTGG